MTKRTFVLFLCLIPFLASLLFSQHTAVACKLNTSANSFSPYHVESVKTPDHFVLVDNLHCEDEAIVRADDFEWKENLSDLLRHRHSTYRFLTLVSQETPDYVISRVPKLIRESVIQLSVTKGVTTLPDYYSFLHRLCPF
jgi:hypothetical protein